MRLLSIDPGTRKMGYAFFVDGSLTSSGIIEAKGNDLGKRLLTIYDGVISLLRMEPGLLLHEEGMVHRCRDGARSLGSALGVVLLAAAQEKVKVEKINVSTWKKGFCGHGLAGKEFIYRAVDAYYPGILTHEQDKDGNFKDQDRADAIGIGAGWLAMEG